MASHDHAITLSNQLVTRGGDGATPTPPGSSVPNSTPSTPPAPQRDPTPPPTKFTASSSAGGERGEFATLSFLELAQTSPLRDAEAPLAAFFNASAEWRAPPPAAASALWPSCAADARHLANVFTFGNLCDADALRLCAVVSWRSRTTSRTR